MQRATASASEFPDFQLHSLGWKAFQDLCLVVLSEQLGQAVKRFSPVRDGGRDGAFVGEWRPTPALELSGETVVQCKFSNRPHIAISLATLNDEIAKAERLWSRQARDNYVLLTNARLTGEFEEAAKAAFGAVGVRNFHAFGYEWLAGAIQASPRLRALVPRLYGLGDLSQILDERWYAQTQKLLEAERDNLRKFVITKPYRQAVEAVSDHGFVLLLGEPAVGKTAIAATLAMACGDVWNCRPMKVDRAGNIRDHWNVDDAKQLFWVDDAFGSMQYESGRSLEWNSILPWLDAVLRSGAKVVLTSRNYIYRHARRDLKQSAFPLLNESQVVVDVANLTRSEREQILYNHVKLGDQPPEWKRSFKRYFDLVAQDAEFRPEIARRLGTKAFTKNLDLSKEGVTKFVAEPEDFLRETIEGLSSSDRGTLAAIFLRGGFLASPVNLAPSEQEIVERVGATPAGVVEGLSAMRDTFVRFVALDEEGWSFKHPTIGDALATLMADDPELMDLYLAGAPLERVLDEVTAGDVALENVKVIIPRSRFERMITRLHDYRNASIPTEHRWLRRRRYFDFLASRCAREFLARYVAATGDFWKDVLSFGSYLSVSAQFATIVTLHEYGLLPLDRRNAVVEKVAELAVETPDADFLRVNRIRAFFSEAEVASIMSDVVDELLPNMDDMIQSWRENFDRSGEPETHFGSLIEALDAFRDYLVDYTDAQDGLTAAIEEVETLISEFEPEPQDDERDDDDLWFGPSSPASPPSVGATAVHPPPRQIFDDLDE